MSADPADLANLRDIVLPPPAAFWPPAPGWWILAAGLLGLLLVALWQLRARHRRNAYRRAALAALDAVPAPLDGRGAAALSAILKRAALAAFPRAKIAALTGDAWLRFLDESAGMNAFTGGPARALLPLALGLPPEETDEAAIRRAARDWIRRHRAGEGRR